MFSMIVFNTAPPNVLGELLRWFLFIGTGQGGVENKTVRNETLIWTLENINKFLVEQNLNPEFNIHTEGFTHYLPHEHCFIDCVVYPQLLYFRLRRLNNEVIREIETFNIFRSNEWEEVKD